MSRRKRSPLKIAKDKAWVEFSKFIRTRDCIRTMNSLDTGLCVSCSREYPFGKLQAGHFLAGRTNAILLDEDLVHAQCYGCNVGRSGQYLDYFFWMERTYGRPTVDKFVQRKKLTLKMNEQDWLTREVEYRQKTEALIVAWEDNDPQLPSLIELGKTVTTPDLN